MANRIIVKCQACGEAENCHEYCELTITNVIEINELLCPVSGEEAEWYIVKDGKMIPTERW